MSLFIYNGNGGIWSTQAMDISHFIKLYDRPRAGKSRGNSSSSSSSALTRHCQILLHFEINQTSQERALKDFKSAADWIYLQLQRFKFKFFTLPRTYLEREKRGSCFRLVWRGDKDLIISHWNYFFTSDDMWTADHYASLSSPTTGWRHGNA